MSVVADDGYMADLTRGYFGSDGICCGFFRLTPKYPLCSSNRSWDEFPTPEQIPWFIGVGGAGRGFELWPLVADELPLSRIRAFR